MEHDRAWRRVQHDRIKRRRRYYWAGRADQDPRISGLILWTPHPCSCPMCGNRRPWEGPTRQERQNIRELRAALADLWLG